MPIDVVYGRPDAAPAVEHGEAVCVDRGADGEVVAVASVAPADVSVVGGRRFFVYRTTGEAGMALMRATFAALDAAFEPAPGAPLGLCVLSDPTELVARPEAAWEDPPLVHAGFLPNGRQVRIGYFDGARIGG